MWAYTTRFQDLPQAIVNTVIHIRLQKQTNGTEVCPEKSHTGPASLQQRQQYNPVGEQTVFSINGTGAVTRYPHWKISLDP